MSVIAAILAHLSAPTWAALRNTVVLALIFTLLPRLANVCNRTPAWWRKPDLSTDLCWAVVPKFLYRITQTVLLVSGIIVCYGIHDPDDIATFLTEGHGPLVRLGFCPQVVLYLLGSDLLMYFTHRLFHGHRLWPFHAVHHSSRHMEWISATRTHPLDAVLHGGLPDVVMLLLGVPLEVLIWIIPFNIGSSAVVHANLDWRFGPLRYVLASPVFHRWHHTSASRGGSSNFAGTFAFIDLVFGTFYMPADQHPDAYGLDDPDFPAGFVGQILHSFLSHRNRAADAAGERHPRSEVQHAADTRIADPHAVNTGALAGEGP
jgi:sterol desaturase/sphingolipid hydroxylase (fatty acid hydroxylase superfamily)